MVSTLKAEFKKLLTVRSTYVMVLIAIFLAGLFNYLGTSPIVYEEVKEPTSSEQEASASREPLPPEEVVVRVSRDLPKEKLATNLQDTIPVVSLFFAVVVVLLMAHEFRHNTITYTLTASNSRSKVLVSKIIVSLAFTIVATILAILTVVAVTYLAVQIRDLNLPSQGSFDWGYILARLLGYTVGFCLLALAIATLVRNIVAGVVAPFILLSVDALIGGLLQNWKNIEASKVLPLSALNRVNNLAADYTPRNAPDDGITDTLLLPATVLGATAVFAAYFIGLWIIAWYLFLRRDAT